MTDLKKLQTAMNGNDVPEIAKTLGIAIGVCREDNPADVDDAYGAGTYARLFPPEPDPFPVLFILDDDGEAMGIRPFCSIECRAGYKPIPQDEGEKTEPGEVDAVDIVDQAVCEMCGNVLEP